jgi:hypothetical protein
MHVLIYAALLVGCLLVSFWRGGGPERIGALNMAIGSVLTVLVNSPLSTRYSSIEVRIFLVDVAVLLVFLALALRSDRYWPLWTTAMQLLVVLAHLARLADPTMLRNGYGAVMAMWSYPQLIIISAAAWQHRRGERRTAP